MLVILVTLLFGNLSINYPFVQISLEQRLETVLVTGEPGISFLEGLVVFLELR